MALFFGLSGTGKTTLSADPKRTLIGDDEHGWSDHGVFNFEGGCYAKVIKLSPEGRAGDLEAIAPLRHGAGKRGDRPRTRVLDLDDDSLTENTRVGLPDRLHRQRLVPTGTGGHPKNVIMLTADAFGVLPPIARLTPEQAMYHFLSGYTAKLAGHRARRDRARAATSAPASARPSCRCPP